MTEYLVEYVETYIKNIQNIEGSLLFNDTLKGNSSNNVINGFGGQDTIYGVGGENTLIGGTGNDLIYTALAANKNGARGDLVLGGEGTDTLVGTFSSDLLIGGEWINNNGTMTYQDVEEDWADYSSYSTTGKYGISVNLTNTTTLTFSGANADRAQYNGNYSQIIQLDSNTGLPIGGTTSPTEFDYLKGIEDIKGTNYIDSLMGDANDNTILAGAGNDTIFLDAGGIDYIDGGFSYTDVNNNGKFDVGTDISTESNWLSIGSNYRGNIDLRTAYNIAGTTNGNVTVYNIQNILGGASGETVWGRNDTVWNETFVMKGGNDVVLGGSGNDYYDLGSGNDVAYSNLGNDTLISIVTGKQIGRAHV